MATDTRWYLDPKQNPLAPTVCRLVSLHEMKLKGSVSEGFCKTQVEKLVDALINTSTVHIATRRTVLDEFHDVQQREICCC